MYGKVFDSMYEGSLYGQWEAIVTMQQLIVIADQHGVVDMTPAAIAGKTSIPIEIITKGIELLESPDEYSRTPDQEGRRIERLDEHRPWGWSIVNYLKYRQRGTREEKKQADRDRLANKRNATKANKNAHVAKCRKESRSVATNSEVSQVSQCVADVAHTDTDTDINTDSVRTNERELETGKIRDTSVTTCDMDGTERDGQADTDYAGTEERSLYETWEPDKLVQDAIKIRFGPGFEVPATWLPEFRIYARGRDFDLDQMNKSFPKWARSQQLEESSIENYPGGYRKQSSDQPERAELDYL